MNTCIIWRNFNIGPIPYSTCNVDGSWHWWWGCWKTIHDISREFRQRLHGWAWKMMTMRLHDEHRCKCRWSQILCGHDMYPLVLKPSHTMKACVLSNHVKFWRLEAQFVGISMLVQFTTQSAMSVDYGIGDGIVGRCCMIVQESFDKYSIDGNDKWWKWDFMMNIDANVDNLKDYVNTTCILES